MDCGFRVENKTARPNPFHELEDGMELEPRTPPTPSGAAWCEFMQTRRGTGGTDAPEAGQDGDRDSEGD